MEEPAYSHVVLVCLAGALIPIVLGLLPRLRLPSVSGRQGTAALAEPTATATTGAER